MSHTAGLIWVQTLLILVFTVIQSSLPSSIVSIPVSVSSDVMETRSSTSILDLRAIAHDRGLKNYMHLSKPDLFLLLQCNEGHGSFEPLKEAKEDTVRLMESVQFEFTRTNGSVVTYNVESLVQYILTAGDFSEPETRIPFSDEDLRQIDLEASKAMLNVKSVVEAAKNKHQFEEQKVRRDGVLGLERCASEYVSKMLEIVESDDREEGEMLLIMNVFPSFSDTFEQIWKTDSEYARHSMSHYIRYMKGPKNRPTVDHSGLLEVILSFLDDVSKGKEGASAFGF